MKTADFYSSATGTLRVNGGRDENAPQGVSLSIDDLSYIKQGSRANENNDSFTPTQAQLDAMNSGITSEDVEQITTNKNNISSEQQKTSSMGTAGTGYIVVNNVRIYVGAIEPTGEIPEGSLWLNSVVINP